MFSANKIKILVFAICFALLISLYIFIKPANPEHQKNNQHLVIEKNLDKSDDNLLDDNTTHNQALKDESSSEINMDSEEIGNNRDDLETSYPIHIMGQVQQPGVYYLEENMIILDAINLAGGLTEEADLLLINLAEKISANQKIYIPSSDELEQNIEEYAELISQGGMLPNNESKKTFNSTTNLININTASSEELQNLNGIGPSKAEAIINYRQQMGSFSSLEELMKVPGIKENSFQKIKDYIKIN